MKFLNFVLSDMVFTNVFRVLNTKVSDFSRYELLNLEISIYSLADCLTNSRSDIAVERIRNFGVDFFGFVNQIHQLR